MTTTACFDFGNTRLKCGLFHGSTLKEVIVLPDDSAQSINGLIEKARPDKSILSSVIGHNPEVETILSAKTQFHKLSHLTRLSFTMPVGKPETMGADRLGLAAAAIRFYPKKNNLVIGLGTCMTFNFIDQFHVFAGGSISPGLEMRLKSLNHYTAKLPLVKADSNVPLIGYDTNTNILSGVILGMAKEIDGIIEAYEERFLNFNALLTGGDTGYLASHIRGKIIADPDLLFKGLYAISEDNNS